MSAITVNGFPLPVSEGTFDDGYEPPPIRRAVDGSVLSSAGWRPRAVSGSTPVLRPSEWRAWEALLNGRGERWRFALDADAYGSRGTLLALDNAPFVSNGNAIYRSSGLFLSAANNKGLRIESATTNILPANARRGTDASSDTTGFSSTDGATLSSSTAAAWQGSRSLKVDTVPGTAGVRCGVFTSDTAAPSSGNYVGSVYVRAVSGTPSVRVYMRNQTAGVSGAVTTAPISSSVWTRIEAPAIAATSGQNIRLYIVEETPESGIAYYCDGFQIEKVGASGQATSWVGAGSDSTDSRGAPSSQANLLDLYAFDDLTVMVDAVAFGSSGPLFRIDGEHLLTVRWQAPNIVVTVDGSDVISAATPADLRYVVLVVRRRPEAGQYGLELWSDQGIIGHASALTRAWSGPTFYLGQGGGELNGLVYECLVLPFALAPEMVATAQSTGFAHFGMPPELSLAGDAFGQGDDGPGRPGYGTTSSARQTTAIVGGQVHTRAASLPFVLTEARRR